MWDRNPNIADCTTTKELNLICEIQRWLSVVVSDMRNVVQSPRVALPWSAAFSWGGVPGAFTLSK